jgi:hypothetical protein
LFYPENPLNEKQRLLLPTVLNCVNSVNLLSDTSFCLNNKTVHRIEIKAILFIIQKIQIDLIGGTINETKETTRLFVQSTEQNVFS